MKPHSGPRLVLTSRGKGWCGGGTDTLDPRRTLFLVEEPTLYVLKRILVAPLSPPPNKQTLPLPLTYGNTGDCLNPGHQRSERGLRGCQRW